MQQTVTFPETTKKAASNVDEKNPTLSVVMLVYNGEKYLAEAMESVLNQTFRDFEFIIINDGSTDRSMEIISEYKDNRIRVINNYPNRGIPYNRNLGLQEARGEYLAWFDCDDILMPTRFEKQIQFLKKHPQYGICGTWLLRFAGEKTFVARVSQKPEIIRAKLLFKTSILNATAMYRLSMIRHFGLTFNNDLPISEDYDFYLRCSQHFPMTNLPEVLYKYRASETSIMKQFEAQETKHYTIHKMVHAQALQKLDLQPNETQFKTHSLITSEKLFDRFDDYKTCFYWLLKLQQQNRKTGFYDVKAFDKVLSEEFMFISKKASRFGWRTLLFYSRHATSFSLSSIYDTTKLLIRCVIQYNKF